MDYRVGHINRVFFARFEKGEDLSAGLNDLARREWIDQALVLVLGSMTQARLVVGPKEMVARPEPLWAAFTGGREVLGVGTLVPGPEGPSIHLHLAAGRGGEDPLIGCLREDGQVYLVAEAVILELKGFIAQRELDQVSGMNLLRLR
ncbi:MAG: PPC domain-containing DNA-binding protein [Thermodesulfobacteriota bacterium]